MGKIRGTEVQLHGWTDDVVVPTRAVFELSDGAFKLLCYLIFRARNEGTTFVGIERAAAELHKSESTIKRGMGELVSKRYACRERRVGTSSITHIFKNESDWEAFAEARKGSSMTRVNSHQVKNELSEQLTDEPLRETSDTQYTDDTDTQYTDNTTFY